jgi:hypothetical protein
LWYLGSNSGKNLKAIALSFSQKSQRDRECPNTKPGNMSKSIIAHTVHNIIVSQRKDDGYLHATALAKAYESATGKRKDVKDWLITKRANDYIQRLSDNTGIPVLSLVIQKQGKKGGTWIHPKLAIPFATWLSVEFEFLVSEIVESWLKQAAVQGQWEEVRLAGKATRRSLTDAVADYIQRHANELSENDKRWMYANASQQIDLVVFGRVAKKLAEDLNAPRENLRDAFTAEELQLVREVEATAMRMIDQLDIHPREAVAQCASRLLIPVQTRKATGQLPGDSES